MALLQSDPSLYRDLDYHSPSPSNKPTNIGTNSPFDTYEFSHLQSPPFPHTPSYNGSYQNSPYSGHSDLSYDPDGPEGFALLGEGLDGLAVREDYDPSEYDHPTSSRLLVFDSEFMTGLDPSGTHVAVSVTPAPIDQHSPRSYDHSSPSSNGEGRSRSRASSVSSNPQILPHSSPHLDVAHNFENLRFESPNWRSNQLPGERTLSPPRKAQSPPQLLIPDSSPALFSQETPLINAPEGDGGFVSSGPQLHIVPATPVSGGGAASQAVPFQSTLETLHQGEFIDIIMFISGTLFLPFLSWLRFTAQQTTTPPWDQQQIQQTEVSKALGVPFHDQAAQLFPHSHASHRGLSTLGPQVHPDGTNTNFLFPNIPPRTRSKSDTAPSLRPQFWNPSLMTQDQLNALEGSALDDSAPTVSLNEVLPQQQQQQLPSHSSFNLSNAHVPQFNFNPATANNMSAYLDPSAVNLRRVKSDSGRPGHTRLSRSEDMTCSIVYPPSSQQEFINRQFLYPQETVPSIRGHHSRRASSGSRGGGDGTWSALSSNRPSPYPSPSASPRVRYEDLPNVALTGGRPPSMLRPDPPQPNNGGLIVSKQTVTSERTAGASHRRRKQDANFLCPVPGCGSTFTRSFNLKGHMRSHNEERPFQCKWPGCGKGFARQHDCKRHEQLHSNYRPFTCDGCNKTFARMDALNRHLRSEGGAECQRILDAAKDSEGLPIAKTEEKGWPGMSVMV
ncbi:hypothetical protein J3R82DRAFT_11296 [Butyriboletus roseoflavus]|nr:hypothetical protein J3R82DRAFT_11296 [Butyriboletus roseoflavus]